MAKINKHNVQSRSSSNFSSELLEIDLYFMKVGNFHASFDNNKNNITKQSVIEYQNLLDAVKPLARKYSDIFLVYYKLPKKISRYHDKRYSLLLFFIYIILGTCTYAFFPFFDEFRLYRTRRFDMVGFLFVVLFLLPAYFLRRLLVQKKLDNIIGLLSELKDIILEIREDIRRKLNNQNGMQNKKKEYNLKKNLHN
jgi:hypothetical protein